MRAPIPDHENRRLAELRQFQILDTPPEEAFDDLVRLAAHICGTPIALVSLVDSDRQWFKAKTGIEATETPRDVAFCAHAIHQPDVMVVPDARKDARFADNPLVTAGPKVRFYAGTPLITGAGNALGTLCVVDRKPRKLSADQLEALRALGRQAVAQLELRRSMLSLKRSAKELEHYFTLSLDMHCIVGFDGYFKRLNPAWEKTLGFTADELRAEPYLYFIHPDDRQATVEEAAKIASGGTTVTFENRYRCKDGSYRTLIWAAAPLPGQQVIYCTAHDVTERRLIVEKLRHSEESYRDLVENSSDLMGTHDLDGVILSANQAFLRAFGYQSVEEVLGRNMIDILVPEVQGIFPQYLAQIAQDGRAQGIMRVVTRDGQERLLEYDNTLRREGLAKPIVRAKSRDVTESKRAERRQALQFDVTRVLAESSTLADAVPRLLQALCQHLEGRISLLWHLDLDAHVLRCAEIWQAPSFDGGRFVEQSREISFTPGIGLPGRVWQSGKAAWIENAVVDKNFPRAAAAREAGLRGGFAFPFLWKGGALGVIECFGRKIMKPDQDLLMILEAIGNQVGQFIERRRVEDAHELILKSAGEGIFGMDRSGCITFVNPAAARMLGTDSSDLIGASEHETIHHSGAEGKRYLAEECPLLGTLRDGAIHVTDEHVFWPRDGVSFPVEYIRVPIPDERDALLGAVVTFQDITGRRAIERMKDEFISLVSHELRTPLTSIRGSLGLLAGGFSEHLPEKGRRMLEIAVRNADRLSRLINDVLDLERMQERKADLVREDCDAGELLLQAAETMAPMAEKAGVILTVQPARLPLAVDQDQILQVLSNLISNAIKFSSPQRTVTLSAERRGDRIVFEVRDEGRGIPPGKLEAVFQRFQQVDASDSRKRGGSGLGLAICRGIVQLHGGAIWAESELGKGSSFFVSLPAKETDE